MSIAGRQYSSGLGTHASSKFSLELHGKAIEFQCFTGIDDAVYPDRGSAEFILVGNSRVLWRSGIMRRGDPARECKISLRGMQSLELLVSDAEDNIYSDHANWAQAIFIMDKGAIPTPFIRSAEKSYIQTPPESPLPIFHGRHLYGARPGSEILYRMPVSGVKPIIYKAQGLPPGLILDSLTGIIKGRIQQVGRYPVLLQAENEFGKGSREFTFIIGDTITFAPIMGWSSWYAHWQLVQQQDILREARALIRTGLADYGFEYIAIDDGWQDVNAPAEKKGLQPGPHFPDMNSLSDSLHSLGLKFGIYSSPGAKTCVLLPASLGHEREDAEYFCRIKADFVKYDWCTYEKIYDSLIKKGSPILQEAAYPYKLMGNYLKQCQGRDIFFNICQYGNNDVWKWGRQAEGHSWRTNTDIQDNWWSMSNTIGFKQNGLERYSGYNGWNDMDFLRIGKSQPGRYKRPTELTADEQYTHISLWALLNSPLFLSCDIDSMDEFTLRLLKNGEVLAINQDKLGRQGYRVYKYVWQEIWAKPLDSNKLAVGLFNRDDFGAQTMVLSWDQLGIADTSAKYRVRDLWKQQDLGIYSGSVSATIPSHGVLLLGLTPLNINRVQPGDTDKKPMLSISPNPLNSDKFMITGIIPQSDQYIISLHNVMGSELSTIYNGFIHDGQYSQSFTLPAGLQSGIYFLRMLSAFSQQTVAMQIVR
jgi:alpha-galactosidase